MVICTIWYVFFFQLTIQRPSSKVNYLRLTRLWLSYKSSPCKLQRTCDLNPQSYGCWEPSLSMHHNATRTSSITARSCLGVWPSQFLLGRFVCPFHPSHAVVQYVSTIMCGGPGLLPLHQQPRLLILHQDLQNKLPGKQIMYYIMIINCFQYISTHSLK